MQSGRRGSPAMTAHRPAFVEIDLDALAHNTRLVRSLIGERTALYAVVKGDAYGIGVEAAVPVLLRAGADAFAAGDFDEAMLVRRLAPATPVLLYGSYLPAQMADIARHGIVLTVYSHDCLEAVEGFGQPDQPVTVSLKVDCGFGRLGLREDEIGPALRRLRGRPGVSVRGLYTHLGAIDDPEALAVQTERFATAKRDAEKAGFGELEYMLASSRVVIDRPDLVSNAINPGRLLYGLLEQPWRAKVPVRPVIRAVKSRLIQVKALEEGRRYGYGTAAAGLAPGTRVGIAAIGFASGVPRGLPGAEVLIAGRRAKVIGLASMEHLLVDVTSIRAAVGDEVVLLGQQDAAEIDGEAYARMTGLTELEILPRLARGLRRCYVTAGSGPEPAPELT